MAEGRKTEEKIQQFLVVLYRKQEEANKKYGARTIFKWRQARLNRERGWW